MAHVSDNSDRLPIEVLRYPGQAFSPGSSGEVCFFALPFRQRWLQTPMGETFLSLLVSSVEKLPMKTVVAVLCTIEDAARLCLEMSERLHFQLWVAVKLDQPLAKDAAHLPEQHAALLIWTRERGSLRHTKTRIAYTYCPACEKTTKDYGGKKHTYHAYGTLMSDVWRDFVWSPVEEPTAIAERLADLFGLLPFTKLRMVVVSDSSARAINDLKRMMTDSQILDNSRQQSIPDSRLTQGDCLAILKTIPDESIDFCFADPPYNLAKKYDHWDDALDIKEYFSWCDQWLDELARVLRPGRTCAVLNIPAWVIRHYAHLQTRLQFQNWIAWEGLSLPVRMIMPAHYAILCFTKGPSRPLPGLAAVLERVEDREAVSALSESYCLRSICLQQRRRERINDRTPICDLWWDIHRLKHNSRRVDHPCQLPPALMRRLIAMFTRPGEIVLDPFDGAGTTSLCAASIERRYFGIELSSKYHEIALRRHQFLAQGGDPFAKTDRVPKSKNSRVKRIGQTQYRVPKKVLQLEVREIARQLGHLPSRIDVERMSSHPIQFFDDYFLNWGEVCAAARTTGMSETRIDGISEKVHQRQPTLFDDGAACIEATH